MSGKKKLLSRLEGMFAGATRLAKDGVRMPVVADSADTAPPAPSAISIDAGGPLAGWSWEADPLGVYTTCSGGVEAVLGFTPDEMLGRSLSHVVTPSSHAAALTQLAEIFAARRPFYDVRLRARRKDGQEVTLILNGLPVVDDADRLAGYRGICQPELSPETVQGRPYDERPGDHGRPPATLIPTREPAPLRRPGSTAAETGSPGSSPVRPSGSELGYVAAPGGLSPIGELSTPEMKQALASGEIAWRDAASASGEAQKAGKALALPIRLQGQTVGVLEFFDEGETSGSAWSEDDMALAQAVADQLALALENAGLLEQITRERERLALLYDVLQALTASRGRPAILYTALHLAPRIGAQHAYALVLGETANDATFLSTLPGLDQMDARQARDFALTISQVGLEKWVLSHGRPAVVPDTQLDDRWYTDRSRVEEGRARSVISIPLQAPGGTMTGVLAYTHSVPGTLTEEHLPIIESIASQVTVALENDRLNARQRSQQYNSAALARTAQAMTRTLDEEELYEILAEQLFESYRPDGVAILRWEPDSHTFVPLAVVLSPDESDLNPRAWPTVGREFSAAQRPELLEVIRGQQGRIIALREEPNAQVRESMALPLLYGGRVEGVVEIVHTGPIQGLTPADIDLFQATLTAAASALQSARLYALQRQTAERLAGVDRLKSQFLANMSHELRTPLNSIIGFSRVILKGIDGPLTDLQTQDLASINSAGQHLLRLINDVLDMAKIEAGKMELVFEDVDLHEVIAGALSTTAALVKDKPVELAEEIAPDLPQVRADAMRIRQVLLNLLSNAAKFTEEGRVTLRARPIEAVGTLRDAGQLEPFVEISVIDTGTGIAPEHMPKLFEAFSQVDASPTRKSGGTGLGLSICRQLVELHGGRIWAESDVGHGSTFYFILPVRQPQISREPASSESPATEAEPAAAAAPVILAVDDDVGVITLYRRYLEPRGYTVVGVNRSSEAMSRAIELRPAAILLDVLMSNHDGWQVLADLKQADVTRDIPVIMCTLVADQERGRRMGAADYLVKPILEAELVRALHHVSDAAVVSGRERSAPPLTVAPDDQMAPP